MRTRPFFSFVLSCLVYAACDSPAAPEAPDELVRMNLNAAEHLTVPVYSHPATGAVVEIPGSARIVSNDAGASLTYHAEGLIPGHVYSAWWVVINAPENCSAHPCPTMAILFDPAVQGDVTYAAARIAGASGQVTFGSHLSVGSLPKAWVGNGFTNPRGAEIHIAIHDHGPRIPALLSSMLDSFRGGCTDASLPGFLPATALADGTPGPNTCLLVQVAFFVQ